MTPAEAVQHLRAQRGDPTKFKQRKRGYVDWKFGEVCEYLGFDRALAYVHSMLSWYEFEQKYADCLLHTTYRAFLEAEKQIAP